MRKNLCKQFAAFLALSVTVASIAPMANVYAEEADKGYGYEVNVGESTFKSDTDKSSAYQEWRAEVWDAGESADSGKVALTPGKDETGVSFTWYSEKAGTPAVKIWVKGKEAEAKVVTGTAVEIAQSNWQGSVYTASNKVYVENYLTENTEYQYAYTDDYNGEKTDWSEAEAYHTHSFSSFTAILTGDPQVGASGSSNDQTAADDSAARDTYNWALTMQSAIEKAPEAAFLLSAGDQIDTSNATKDSDRKTRESEYAGYLYPSVFRSLPIASTIGNHDRLGDDYTLHFANPNASELGATEAGGDYYFSYGDVLFISLNSNNRNQQEHRVLMQQAVTSHPDAKWKVVIFHSDIYGSGEPHADTDASSNRIIFAPLMDEFDIDICLTGHDHTYSRSYQIYNGNVIDYDLSSGSVQNPEGTLYITTGSGSGSKYYNLLNYTPYYIAERTNVCLPAYSTIEFTENSLTLNTYDYNGNQYADSFTIYKNADEVSLEELEKRAAAIDEAKYTEESVAALKDALAKLRLLYEITEDAGADYASAMYNTDLDPFTGYGSVKAEYRDMESGSAANRAKRGFSSLLDKTIYRQFDKMADASVELPVVSADVYENAKNDVVKAFNALALAEGPTTVQPDDDEPTTADSEKGDEESSTKNFEAGTASQTGDEVQSAPATGDAGSYLALIPLALGSVVALIAMMFRKKEENC